MTALLQRAGTCVWAGGDVLVPEADVLRFEDLSVGHFAAGDNVQFVHGLHHSPARREGEIKNNRSMTNVEGKNSCYAALQVSPVRFLVTMDTKQRDKLCHSQIQPAIDDAVHCRERKIEYLNV